MSKSKCNPIRSNTFRYFPDDTRQEGTLGTFENGQLDGITPRLPHRAWEGDTVYYVAEPGSGQVRITSIYNRRKVLIAGILLLTSLKKYGKTTRGLPIYKMIPLSAKYPPMYVASSHRTNATDATDATDATGAKGAKGATGATVDIYALVEFKEWTAFQKYPHMNMVRVLGRRDDPLAENQALLYKNEVYRKPVIPVIPVIPANLANQDRTVFPLECGITTIDPIGSEDLDDAFHVTVSEIYVHIADVDYYIGKDTALDKELQTRVTSIYGPVLSHMLPEAYSNDIISLKPNGPKAAITVVLMADPAEGGGLKAVRHFPSFIFSTRALTYETAQLLLETGHDDTLTRAARFTGTTDCHKIIEKLMILCNTYIGAQLAQAGRGLIRTCVTEGVAARYTPIGGTDTEHVIMNLSNYTHFTSPIRRYADLVVHRLVKNPLAYAATDIDTICSQINHYNVKVRRYYRDNEVIKLFQYVQNKGGLLRTSGTLVAYTDGKITVFLPELNTEYRYPIMEKKINQSLADVRLPLNSHVDIVLRTDEHEIKLNRRVIMHLPALQKYILSDYAQEVFTN